MMVRGRGRPKVKTDDVQRDEILKAARQRFLGAGYSATTMDGIATHCGISKRTLYRLYPSKTDLFSAIIKGQKGQFFRLPPPEQALSVADALAFMFGMDDTRADWEETEAVLRTVVREAGACPELKEIVRRDASLVSVGELASWLAMKRDAGEVTIDDPEAYAWILMDMIFGDLTRTLPDDTLSSQREARRSHIRRCIAIFLNGILPPPSKGAPPTGT